MKPIQTHYDRPRLIHQAHVTKILDLTPLKDGNGKELRRLHDVAQQHLRALKSMGEEPSGSFVTSMLELKLDAGTLFKWHKHSQEEAAIPHYRDLLEFINLRAQDFRDFRLCRGGLNAGRPVTAFTASTGFDFCVLCKHPLYSCANFKAQRIATVKSNNHCMNCLRPGQYQGLQVLA